MVNNPTSLLSNGYSIGKWKDDTEIYVGLGDNLPCYGNPAYTPGRIHLPSKGIYISCIPTYHFVNTTVFSLLPHPNYKWVNVSGSLADVPGVVTYGPWRVGRKWLNGTEFNETKNWYEIGKIYPSDSMLYMTPNGEVTTTTFEVLTCAPHPTV